MMASVPSLGSLPSEIVCNIISFLDASKPPSWRLSQEEPSSAMVYSESQPLKELSRTCHRMRHLTFDSLFKFVRFRFTDELVPESQVVPRPVEKMKGEDELSDGLLVWQPFHHAKACGDFAYFVQQHHLKSKIKSVTLYIASNPAPGDPKACDDRLLRAFIRTINPDVFTILAPPRSFGDIGNVAIDTRDAWAFDVPFHLLHLVRLPTSSAPATTSEDPSFEPLYQPQWYSCVLNEGSSVKAYDTYDYWHLSTPSVLQLGSLPNFTSLTDSGIPCSQASLGDRLTIFDYVATFPLAAHVARVFSAISHMRNLDTLRIRLAARSKSEIWKDLVIPMIQKGLGGKLGQGYMKILGTVRDMGDTKLLQNFCILDYETSGPEIINNIFNEFTLSGWVECNTGCWKKRKLEERALQEPESALTT